MRKQPGSLTFRRARAIVWGAAAFAVAAFVGGAAEGADNVAKGQRIWLSKGGCPFCHGWAADGSGDAHSDGPAPSLRVTQLNLEQLREVIKCGRPGAQMPHFDAFAYTDDRCYGVTAAELGEDTPQDPPTPLQPHEINAVADYIDQKIRGAGPVTREECQETFSADTKECQRYPSRGAAVPVDDRRQHAALSRHPNN
jgi:mono/diheme cytochrome c family protein